jgi:hypothetical protein
MGRKGELNPMKYLNADCSFITEIRAQYRPLSVADEVCWQNWAKLGKAGRPEQ